MLRARASGAEREQVVMVFREGVAAARVAAAWHATVAATAVLRTGLLTAQGEAAGWEERPPSSILIEPEAEPPVFEDWLEEDRRRDFAWETDVPWRAVYWRASRRWVWTFHHGLLDGRSITRILREFLARVQGGTGHALSLPVWKDAGPEAKAAAAAHFASVIPGVEPAEVDFGAKGRGVAATRLGAESRRALEAAATAHGVTPSTIVLWAWGQAMARTAGVEAVSVGQVRSGPPLEATAGFSMNTLPVIVRRGVPGDTAAAGWQAVRAQMLALREFESLAPADLPGELVGPAGGAWSSVAMIERGTLRHQLGEEAAALLESVELRERSSGALVASAYLRPDLRLEVEGGGDLGPAGAEALLAHWAAIVRRAATTPEARLQDLTALPEEMTARLAAWESGGPSLPGPAHLADAWRATVSEHAAAAAVWTPEETWTYAEAASRVDRLAGALAAEGVRPGQTVAVRAGRRAEWLIALLAIVCLGAVYLPLARRLPPSRVRAMVADSAAEFIVGEPLAEDDFGLRRVAPAADVAASDVAVSSSIAGNDVLALLYTSGSTGEPKGVMLDHHGVLNEARWAARSLGLGPGDRVLQFASPGFDASLEEMLSCVLSGATLVPRPEALADDLTAFHDFLSTAGITVLDLPTAFWSEWVAWLRETGRRVPALKATIIGGERASARALADWRAAGGGILWNSYGPTEASIVASAQEIGGWDDDTDDPPIGRPLPGYLLRVADDRGEARPPGAAGEIWIGGPGVGPGYWRRPDLTAAVFVEKDGQRWYRTGDLGRWDEAGRVRFLGRRDDQLKIRGQRVEPAEVIHHLESFPGVGAAHVGAVGTGSHRPLAAWIRWEGAPPDAWPQRLRDHLAGHVPAVAIPTRWMAVEAFALTERGKLDREALPEPPAGLDPAAETPATPTEEKIAAWWRQWLGVDTVGRQDSFFDLGGNSLAALRLFARLAEEFGTRLPMASLIQTPTLAALARTVDDLAACPRTPDGVALPHVVPLRVSGEAPPLFCIHGGDGGVLFYRELAHHLTAELSLVTIESPALSAEERVHVASVEESARGYVAAVRRHQARGPYHLAGYSYGGVLVYEMAAQLRAEGEEVAFLGLFDTENPARPGRKYTLPERAAVFWRAHGDAPLPARAGRLLTRIITGLGASTVLRSEAVVARLTTTSRPHGKLRALQVREAHAAAMEAYQPRPVDVPVVLFKTQAIDDKFATLPDYGWTGLPAALEIIDVPGAHLTMFSPEHASVLAREVGRLLNTRRA